MIKKRDVIPLGGRYLYVSVTDDAIVYGLLDHPDSSVIVPGDNSGHARIVWADIHKNQLLTTACLSQHRFDKLFQVCQRSPKHGNHDRNKKTSARYPYNPSRFPAMGLQPSEVSLLVRIRVADIRKMGMRHRVSLVARHKIPGVAGTYGKRQQQAGN